MTKAIPKYPGDQRSLINDAHFLIHLRALNIAAGDRGVSFAQLWIDTDNEDFPIAYRTAQACMRRLADSALLLLVPGTGRSPSGYYAPYCSLERILYALRFGLKDDQMFAPDNSPVCLVWESPCECYSMLAAAERGWTIYTAASIRLADWRLGDPFVWRQERHMPRELHSALRFIKQLRNLERELNNLNIWEIPSVKHVLNELERAGLVGFG